MNQIKKAGIIGGAIVGGAVGGTLSVVGKVTGIKIIDDIGTSIVDSTILTGTIAGGVAGGTADVISGKLQKEPEKVEEGVHDLKVQGKQVINNFTGNVCLAVENASEIGRGIVNKDPQQIVEGTKTFVKMAAVGAITVGAIKLSDSGQASGGNSDENPAHDSHDKSVGE